MKREIAHELIVICPYELRFFFLLKNNIHAIAFELSFWPSFDCGTKVALERILSLTTAEKLFDTKKSCIDTMDGIALDGKVCIQTIPHGTLHDVALSGQKPFFFIHANYNLDEMIPIQMMDDCYVKAENDAQSGTEF